MTRATDPATAPPGLPFWVSLVLLPAVWLAAAYGGLLLLLPPFLGWWLFAFLDQVGGSEDRAAAPGTPDPALGPHRHITLIWPPLQIATLFGVLAFVTRSDHLSAGAELAAFFGMGVVSGAVGIVYAHELMHQSSRIERRLADLLLASVLYGHFRSEHLLVHHVHVATPRDTATARYNEGFHRFFLRVLPATWRSAFHAERQRLARRGRPMQDLSNPFWLYFGLQTLFLLCAFLIGGLWGLVLFGTQALVAVWQLELVNYVEHYGLIRRQDPDGRYEPVGPHHSWTVSPAASNFLLINLQRHADHHLHPSRRYPALRSLAPDLAPQLPHGYPVMTALALVPPAWRRVMNPRVRAWRRQFYPDVKDWDTPVDYRPHAPVRPSAARSARSA